MTTNTDADFVKSLEVTLSAYVLQAVQSLHGDIWAPAHYDRRLRQSVKDIVSWIGATALLISTRHQTVNLYYHSARHRGADPGSPIHEAILPGVVRRAVDDHCSRHRADGAVGFAPAAHQVSVPGAPDLRILLRTVAGRAGPGDSPDLDDPATMVGALAYRPADVWSLLGSPAAPSAEQIETLTSRYWAIVGNGLLPMLIDGFRYREGLFAAFPPAIVGRYWDDAPRVTERAPPHGRGDRRPRFQPPWDMEKLAETATLSMDLRKSTYCMEYARSERDFGQWLDHLVEKMRTVSHLHGGVFDKFTGDGCLVHFLNRECRAIYKRTAVDAAIHCAVDMQRAVEIHMKQLRRILHHDSPLFGAGVAIDVGQAFWSYDHRHNPIVVGKGVVGACRVGDKAPRQAIRLTNIAYMSASDGIRKKLDGIGRMPLSTKEAGDALELQCWEFYVQRGLGLGYGTARVERLCDAIKRRYESRQSDGREPTPGGVADWELPG